jgi:hypothetical protein
MVKLACPKVTFFRIKLFIIACKLFIRGFESNVGNLYHRKLHQIAMLIHRLAGIA